MNAIETRKALFQIFYNSIIQAQSIEAILDLGRDLAMTIFSEAEKLTLADVARRRMAELKN